MAHSEAFLKLLNELKPGIKECNVDDVVAMRDKGESFHLVDTREDKEWEKGRIKDAIHIGKGVIERDIEKNIADKSAKVVLYCGGGFRSIIAADSLQKMGYTDVISMDGGWREWVEKELPTE